MGALYDSYLSRKKGQGGTPTGSLVQGSQYEAYQTRKESGIAIVPEKKEPPPTEAPQVEEKQEFSLFGELSRFISNKLNSIVPGGTQAGIERVKKLVKERPKELFLPTATAGEPFRQYVADTGKAALNAIKGAGKITPAYMAYRAASGNPMGPKEYGKELLTSGLEAMNVAWRVQPAAPIVGAGFGSWAGVRKYVQGKIDKKQLIQYPTKGLVEQPFIGEAITDNIKVAEAINTVFIVGMFTRGIAKKKLGDIKLRGKEASDISKTLGVKPNASMETVNKKFKAEMKKIPDTFTNDPIPENLQRRMELTNAYNAFKELKLLDKKFAQAYDFLNKRFEVKVPEKAEVKLPKELPEKAGVEAPKVEKPKEVKPVEKPQITAKKKVSPTPKKVSKVEPKKPSPPSKKITYDRKKGLVLEPTRAKETKKKTQREAEIEEMKKLADAVGFEGPMNISFGTKTGYKRPKVGKVEFRTILQAEPEFRENPILKVNKNKELVWKGTKTQFKIKPGGASLLAEGLKPGDSIRVDEEAIKTGGRKMQMRVYRGNEVYASTDKFADLENLTQKKDLKVVEFPEMVRMARDIMGEAPIIKMPRFRPSMGGYPLGLFKPVGKGRIQLNPEVFKDESQAAKTLAHEMGHMADYFPNLSMKRGNIVGRIATLNKNMKDLYGDLSNKAIREELKALSEKWKPYQGASKSYIKYRESSVELYADAVSVLFNDPALLKRDAPKFYKGFFEYMDRKPSVKENFEKTWELLNQGDDAVFKARDAELNRSFEKGEEAFAAKYLDKQKRKTSLMYQVKLLFDDKNTPIIDKINKLRKTGTEIPSDLNPDYALKGLLYSDGKLKNYVNNTFQPVFAKTQQVADGWNEFGKILFYERVINERGELANPQGYSPTTAKKQLDTMKKNMSSEDWSTLQDAKKLFRKAVKKSNKYAKENEYYSPELIKQIEANPSYATYQVVDYLDTYITPRVYKQKGTLKDIANPATSTVMKLVSVRKAIERNNVKKLNMEFLNEHFPESIEKAKTRWNGKNLDITQPKDPDMGLVIVIEEGKPQGYYVEKDIAEMLNYTSNRTLEAAAKVSRTISQSKFYRPLFTSYNVGFQTFNFVRDITRAWKNYPHQTLAEVPLSPIFDAYRVGRGYIKAVKPSYKRVVDKPDVLIQEMENANILGVTYGDIYGGQVEPEAKQIERVLSKYGAIEPTKKPVVLRPFSWGLDKIQAVGDFIETLPKVAGYIELKGSIPEAELAEYIRTAIGSPAFRVGGTATPVTNNIFLFSNAIKEGIKTDIRVATGKKGRATGAGFWWKTIIRDFLPKFIMAATAGGYFGKELKEIMDGASEYDKTNYTIIPLGIDENGKSVYYRLPSDETGRFLGGLLWKSININKDTATPESIAQIFSFGAGQFPNLSPSYTGAGALSQYLSGKNPYDSYRGRYIIPETTFKAGMSESWPKMRDWLLKNQGLGVFYPTYKPEDPTDLEKILTKPFLSNILGRWVRVSDYGKTEKLRAISKDIEKERSKRLLREREIIDDAIKEYKSGKTSKFQLEKRIVKDIVGDPPYTKDRKTKQTNTIKKFRIGIIRGEGDVNMNSLIDANTNAEKVELLLEIKKKLSDKDFDELLNVAKKNKIISNDVIKEYKKQI